MFRNVLILVLAIVLALQYNDNNNFYKRYLNKSISIKKELDLEHPDIDRAKLATNAYIRPELLGKRDRQQIGIENATILMLTRNWELPGVLDAMRSLEDRFNRDYKYPWTFLNDEPFTDDFIEKTSLMASGKTEYGLIPEEEWSKPKWINDTRMQESMDKMVEDDVIYAGSLSYRNMCRFNSGFFYKQELVKKYDYYFRVEPNVEYMCDFQYDPFTLMRKNGKLYGFIITIHEYEATIPTLWDTIEKFMDKYPEYIHENNAFEFITNKDIIGNIGLNVNSHSRYNLCHFWSNFEIGSLEFFRSKAYNDFFDFLEETGNFYYERWGDAPVHTLAVSLLMDKNKIHYFDDIGYYHEPFLSCPTSNMLKTNNRCICKKNTKTIDLTPHSCLSRWWKFGSGRNFLKEF
ncbi:hypothetical protein PACTADRAFT_50354 [Pachysolen tannophilus NRRL Y-2460]|uniref:Glycosyltransferase family 15 protein n=1 Tax=Pachysolen tannophilus NRRL Y-2460 TaxID=669874 RepID=A0A1E4TVA3_PACTA|nr:hypothetical protein PACTADRAFT_50354 [Pachysolen tannophilus NRRL Y-2460]